MRQKLSQAIRLFSYTPSNVSALQIASLVQPFLSPKGRVSADSRANTVLIRDIEKNLQALGFYPAHAMHGRCSEPL